MIEKKMRVAIISIIFAAIFGIFVLRLINLQLVNGEEYLKQSQSSVVRKVSVDAPRGEILDRNFLPIVTNKSAFEVNINTTLSEDLNKEILTLINIFESCGQEYIDTFPISEGRPYVFDSDMFGNERAKESFDTYRRT